MTAQLRGEGQSWREIARHIQDLEHVNGRVALRLAHGWTQEEVATRWNGQWPPKDGSTGITDKNISYWETWPQSGYEPSLKTLKRLAQLYQCDVGQLVEDGDYRHLDQANRDTDAELSAVPVSTELRPQGAVPLALSPGGLVVPGDIRLSNELVQATTSLSLESDEPAGRLLAPLQVLARLARQPGGTAREREVVYAELVQYLAVWADTMNRRDLLRMLGWAATAAAATPLFPGLNLDEQARVVQVLDAPQRIDETVIEHIETVLWSAMRQDDSLGPQAALDTVLAQRNLTRAILPEAPLALRPRLLSLFSNLSRFAGWLSFDLSDLDSAAYYYEQARTAAHEAENTELGVFVLCNMSHLATWRGQPRVGIDHAVAAQGWARETDDTLLRAYVDDVAARAYGTAGLERRCMEVLRRIPDDLDTTTHSPATSLAYFYGPGEYASTRAQCLLLLHQAPQAIEAAQEALAQVGQSFVRNRAFVTLFLGEAYIESGEIAQAARVIRDGADLAARNRSARLVGLLTQARSRLEPWQRTRAVKELDERLTAYGWGRNSIT